MYLPLKANFLWLRCPPHVHGVEQSTHTRTHTHTRTQIDYSSLGQERALCPGCLHTPQSLCLLGLGSSGLAGVVVVVVVVDVPGVMFGSVEGVVEDSGAGARSGSGSGSPGFGQVTSLHSSGQTRYHCLERERLVGKTRSGRSVAVGAQSSLKKLHLHFR